MQYKRKRKAAREENEEGEGSKGTPARVDEESTSGSASTGDRARGELRSKNREDARGRRRAARVDVGKVKGCEVKVIMGEYVVRHRCAFDSICTLVDELSEEQREANRRVGADVRVQEIYNGPVFGSSASTGVEPR